MCDWKTLYPNLDNFNLTPNQYIGEVDAITEWNDDIQPEKLFVHTESYKTATRNNTLFIVGRRGTGKTAIMQMLNYEIKKKTLKNYNYCQIINQDDSYHELSTQIRYSTLSDAPFEELVHILKKKWLWIFKVSAMYSVFEDKDVSAVNKKKITDYLVSNGILNGEFNKSLKPFKFVTDVLASELSKIDYTPAKVGGAIYNVGKTLFSTSFEEAEIELYQYLTSSRKKCLVLVDSIDRFRLRDNISQSVLAGLIQAILDMYNGKDNFICIKAALPSEIYPHIITLNWGKIEDKLHIILWSYKDLVILLAKRFYKSIIDRNVTDKSLRELDIFKNAQSFLYSYFPETVMTHSNIEFDTLSYIVSHTQKKPRQIIFLVNTILTFAEKAGVDFKSIPDHIVRDGIHVKLDTLVKETLQMYEQIYPNAEEIVMRALSESEIYFDYSELDRKLKEVNSLLESDGIKIRKEDVKRLLLESGTVGIARELHKLANRKSIRIAMFEYQVKGNLVLNNSMLCVIHPMFFQELHATADMDTYIHPVPADECEIEIIERTIHNGR